MGKEECHHCEVVTFELGDFWKWKIDPDGHGALLKVTAYDMQDEVDSQEPAGYAYEVFIYFIPRRLFFYEFRLFVYFFS